MSKRGWVNRKASRMKCGHIVMILSFASRRNNNSYLEKLAFVNRCLAAVKFQGNKDVSMTFESLIS